MNNSLTLHNATKFSTAHSVLLCCTFLKAQAPCGNSQGPICCDGYPTACSWNSQGQDYCITAYVDCGVCGGTGNYVIDSSPGSCNHNGGLLSRSINGLLASAKGREELIPSCEGGFRPRSLKSP